MRIILIAATTAIGFLSANLPAVALAAAPDVEQNYQMKSDPIPHPTSIQLRLAENKKKESNDHDHNKKDHAHDDEEAAHHDETGHAHKEGEHSDHNSGEHSEHKDHHDRKKDGAEK